MSLRWLAILIGSVVMLNVGTPAVALSQLKSPPGGTTPAGAIFDRLNSATTRPLSGRATNGDIVNFPAGTQPPAHERQAP
jgi:hypothetical protein